MAHAERLAFICKDNEVYSKKYNFEWSMGLAISQLRKSIKSFHKEIRLSGIDNVVEVSRKSENEIGNRLSAFNLIITLNGNEHSVESCYHSAKVFGTMQFLECLNMDPKESKAFIKEKHENLDLKLTGFNFLGKQFSLDTKSMCYDYIYIMGISQNEDLGNEIIKYDCFTDIVYNQNKAVACQARTCALYKYLKTNNLVEDFLKNPFEFKKLYKNLYQD